MQSSEWMAPLIIERATRSDIPLFLSLAKEEGWNPGIDDATPFFETDPNGFFIGRVEGEAIGCISAVAYGESFGFMGFYIVLPQFRGKGFGIELWNRALESLGSRTIGLDGVPKQQENYKKSGFNLFAKNMRFSGRVKGAKGQHLVSLEEISLQRLIDYDTPIFGLNRGRFLKHWVAMPNSYGLAHFSSGQLRGYGVIRTCERGHKIGPLFADSAEIAEEIFLNLIEKSDAQEVFFDVTEKNKAALILAQKFKLDVAFETARMYRGKPPKQELSKLFGITTFELG